MTFLDGFSLFVLVPVVIAVVAIGIVLGAMPGRIARRCGHPQAEAINVCGQLGVITMGVALLLALLSGVSRGW